MVVYKGVNEMVFGCYLFCDTLYYYYFKNHNRYEEKYGPLWNVDSSTTRNLCLGFKTAF